MSHNFDDKRLRKLLRSYPGKAITLMYEAYYHKLKSFACTLTTDEATAEDVVQETFLDLWENAHRLDELHQCSLQSYIVKMVRNKAVTAYRKAVETMIKRDTFLNGQTTKDLSVEAKIIRAETNQLVRNLIAGFPRRERECLMMKMDDGLSPIQTAEALDISLKAVERALTSAKKRLRKQWSAINKKS
jgi:RNA polymerase sigma-70 factor (ECF subfamily)